MSEAGKKIIIGSRGSDLALWQAHTIKRRLELLGHVVDIEIIKTKGDAIQHLSFDKIEGKGFFTKEIEEELLKGHIDLAVHSHKDLETTNPKGLVIAAVSEREDPSDILLVRKNSAQPDKKLALGPGAIVGTSSARRKSQLRKLRPDIKLADIRGNVPTRIEKLRQGNFDAIMLAAAGLKRLELDVSDLHVVELDPREFIPAPAQGVLALQIREEDVELFNVLQALNHPTVQNDIAIERDILRRFQGGCQLPLGAFSEKLNGRQVVYACVANSAEESPEYIQLSGEDLAVRAVEHLRQASSADEAS